MRQVDGPTVFLLNVDFPLLILQPSSRDDPVQHGLDTLKPLVVRQQVAGIRRLALLTALNGNELLIKQKPAQSCEPAVLIGNKAAWTGRIRVAGEQRYVRDCRPGRCDSYACQDKGQRLLRRTFERPGSGDWSVGATVGLLVMSPDPDHATLEIYVSCTARSQR